ncbi:MAG: PmoA family protein [Maioricimonas sp. JB049]
MVANLMTKHDCRSFHAGRLALAYLACLCGATIAGAAEPHLVELLAGPHDRDGSLMIGRLPSKQQLVGLTIAKPSEPIVAQRIPDSDEYAWRLERPLPAGQTRQYRVTDLSQVERPHVAIDENDDAIVVRIDGRTVLQYNVATVQPPAGLDPVYARSGFIHPLQSPAGRVVTAGFPKDHAHQHGIFSAWVRTEFEGRQLDFWNQRDRTGHVRHLSVDRVETGPVFAQFDVTLAHSDRSAPEQSRPVLQETWTVRVYHSVEPFLFDIVSTQTCIADSPLQVQKYHYGGMAFRGTSQWLNQPEAGFLTSDRHDRQAGNHTRPKWVAATGAVDGAACTLAVLDHPANFRFPQPVRLHPSKPYFVFTPPFLGAFALSPGQPYVSRYRYVVHDGPPAAEAYDRLWIDYGAPALVRAVADGTPRE